MDTYCSFDIFPYVESNWQIDNFTVIAPPFPTAFTLLPLLPFPTAFPSFPFSPFLAPFPSYPFSPFLAPFPSYPFSPFLVSFPLLPLLPFPSLLSPPTPSPLS